GYRDGGPEGQFIEGHRDADGQVVAVALEHRVGFDVHGDVQVARGRSAHTGLALAGQPDALTVLDPHRHPDADRAGTGGRARAAAVHARALHDRARAAAVRARLGEGEVPLAAAGHALAVAGRADLRAGARPGPGAVAHGARARAGQLELDHRAFGGLT